MFPCWNPHGSTYRLPGLSRFGYNLPAALIGVIDLVLIIAIIYLHTSIVLYNQKRKCRTISEGFTTIFKREDTNEDER